MSKPRKQYNPNKASAAAGRLAQSAGQSPAAAVLGRASSMRVDNIDGLLISAGQVQTHSIAMLAALDQYHTHGDGTAFRALCHWYRVAGNISNSTRNARLNGHAQTARLALVEISKEADIRPLPTNLQYQRLRVLMLSLIDLLPCLPAETFNLARQASHAAYLNGIEAQFSSTPPMIRRMAADAIRGTPIKALAGSDRNTREQLLDVAMIAHGFLLDSTLPIPETLTDARRIKHRLLPAIQALEARLQPQEKAA